MKKTVFVAIALFFACSCEHINIYSLKIPPASKDYGDRPHPQQEQAPAEVPPEPPVEEMAVAEPEAETPEEKKEEERHFFVNVPDDKKIPYTVKEDDSLASIAKKFNSTPGSIQMLNGMKEDDLRLMPGQKIFIYKGIWKIRIRKDEHRLYLYDGEDIYKTYGVCIGENNRTPSGTFVIASKLKKPDWLYKGRRYPFGHEENKLGTRWMSLKPTGSTDTKLTGYGIHGTWRPECIGKSLSNGCIRMKNEDINELFAIAPYKTEVIIIEE